MNLQCNLFLQSSACMNSLLKLEQTMLHDLIQTVQYHEELNFKTFFKIISFKPNTGNLGMFSPSEYKKTPKPNPNL